tara:strand:- start:855 stop:1091 length:237 start_codon:yes stop_codon:yes gene_type:complete
MLKDHLLDLQRQYQRAYKNTKVEEYNKIGKDIALVSIAITLEQMFEKDIVTEPTNAIMEPSSSGQGSNDRTIEEDVQK